MVPALTEEEFSKHVNTKFRVGLDGDKSLELELDEVKSYLSQSNEQTGMERFSLYFNGPNQPFLSQASYAMDHDQMGEFEIFIVPLAQNEAGFRYESVFNYFKKSDQ